MITTTNITLQFGVKSTFMKILDGDLAPVAGYVTLVIGNQVRAL